MNFGRCTTALAVVGLLSATSCTTLPSVGPSEQAIVKASTSDVKGLKFELIDLMPDVAALLSHHGSSSLYGRYGSKGGADDQRIGVGDMVEVAIFEAGPGLFASGNTEASNPGSNSVKLPPQVVDRSGMISIPYANRVKAAGRTPYEIQRTIEDRLKDKAIEPQAIVTVSDNRSSLVTVTGDVKSPGQFPMSLMGTRLLDILAQAGGNVHQPYQTFVRVNRGSTSAVVSLSRIIRERNENIYLRPKDTVVVTYDPQTFTAFGAAGKNGTYEFEYEQLSAAEALATAGGLLDTRASPKGIFIYRYEPREIVRQLRPDSPLLERESIPVIYRIDLKAADGFFLAQSMKIRDKDLVYIANADSVQLLKFLQILTTANTAVTGTVTTSGTAVGGF